MYREYFAQVIKSQGLINLNVDQFFRLMNILILEHYIDKRKEEGHTPKSFQICTRETQKMIKLTKGLMPERLLQDILRESQN